MRNLFPGLGSLNAPNFVKLYLAQAVNLTGDALTWVGLALLAYELAGDRAGVVLATALTLRVTLFVLLSPIAGVVADRIDRKRLMIATHLGRLLLVSLLPLVDQLWQLYAILAGLNAFGAFFTPTYTATLPLVTTPEQRPRAIALSSATYQLLGVLGPGLAGAIAAFVGTRQVFWLDGLTFLGAAMLIATVPGQLIVPQQAAVSDIATAKFLSQIWPQILADLRVGSDCLWRDALMRYAILLQLCGAIAGAQILVNTVNHVQTSLHLGQLEYGWAMATFGLGATLASVWLGQTPLRDNLRWMTGLMSCGAMIMAIALLPANGVNLGGLLLLWGLAGVGQTLVNLPTQVLIAERVAVELQGRVYGAQFAWSHFWWAFAYPLAGGFGQRWPQQNFTLGGGLALGCLLGIYLSYQFRWPLPRSSGQWHIHTHCHDRLHDHAESVQDGGHDHAHAVSAAPDLLHHHLHFHPSR
jgi:MFS transporter, NRE family, putaive nickel resistance protein